METRPKYTSFDADQEDRIRSVSPRELGLVPADERRFGHYMQPRGEKFFSPFRQEKSPSLHIYPNRDRAGWHAVDYGDCQKVYDPASLLVRILNLSDEYITRADGTAFLKSAYHAAQEVIWYDILQGGERICAAPSAPSNASCRKPNGIVLDAVMPLGNSTLLDYLSDVRCLSRELMKKYFEQVKFHFSATPNSHIYAIGQKNSKGGYVIRLADDERAYRKLNCGPGAPTYRGRDGMYTDVPTARNVLILEGMLEFPSWLVLHNKSMPFRDVVILNSVANVGDARDFIMRHKVINCCLNRDGAGVEAMETIRGWCRGRTDLEFHDSSRALCQYNDLNEMLVAQRKGMAPGGGPSGFHK